MNGGGPSRERKRRIIVWVGSTLALTALITTVVVRAMSVDTPESPTTESEASWLETLLGRLDEQSQHLTASELPAGMRECLGGGVPPERVRTPPETNSVEDQVAALIETVETIRGLEFIRRPEPRLLDPETFRAEVREQVAGDLSDREAEAEGRILSTLGLMPPRADYKKVIVRSTVGGTAGFYDPQDEDVVVRVGDSGLDADSRATLVHELTHALSHQRLGWPGASTGVGGHDSGVAIQSLLEGDATLTMWHYVLTLPPEQQAQVRDPLGIGAASVGVRGVPDYVVRELLFPYGKGLEFVCELYRRGGWEAVNAAYADPPTMTLQILLPPRYFDTREPVDPVELPGPPPPWKLTTIREFGAADLLEIFRAGQVGVYEGVSDPTGHAGRWTGGEISLWTNGPRTALGISLMDEEVTGGFEYLCIDMARWYRGMFPESKRVTGRLEDDYTQVGPSQSAVVQCSGPGIRTGIAPDLATARQLLT